jgi:hypothetical protein
MGDARDEGVEGVDDFACAFDKIKTKKKTEFSKIFCFFEKESLTGHHIISSWPKKKQVRLLCTNKLMAEFETKLLLN